MAPLGLRKLERTLQAKQGRQLGDLLRQGLVSNHLIDDHDPVYAVEEKIGKDPLGCRFEEFKHRRPVRVIPERPPVQRDSLVPGISCDGEPVVALPDRSRQPGPHLRGLNMSPECPSPTSLPYQSPVRQPVAPYRYVGVSGLESSDRCPICIVHRVQRRDDVSLSTLRGERRLQARSPRLARPEKNESVLVAHDHRSYALEV